MHDPGERHGASAKIGTGCEGCAGARQMKETPLIRCAHNGHLQAVKLLMARGADVNSLDLARPPARQPMCPCAP
jgi:hypothetical protein